MTTWGAKLGAIGRILSAHRFFLVTDTACAAAADEEFMLLYVPGVYQQVTEVDLKHRAKQVKKQVEIRTSKEKYGKAVIK